MPRDNTGYAAQDYTGHAGRGYAAQDYTGHAGRGYAAQDYTGHAGAPGSHPGPSEHKIHALK